MKEEVLELNKNIENVGNAIRDMALSSVPLTAEIVNIPWTLTSSVTIMLAEFIDGLTGEK